MLNKYAYHLPHVILLGKKEATLHRKLSLKPGDIETTRDYSDRLSFDFKHEFMSTHFGNSASLSMEGVCVRHYKKDVIDLHNVSQHSNFDQEGDTISQFHSHFSDSKIQNAGSTHQHMNVLLSYMKDYGLIVKGGTLYCNSDGAAKQYRCANALYYLSCLATKYGIEIDRAISAPGHGKDVVDGLNAVDKHYLKKIMNRPKIAQEYDLNIKKIRTDTMEGNEVVSIAYEAARLCRLDRTFGAQSFMKYKKREQNRTIVNRVYHVRKERENKIEYINMKTLGLPKNSESEKYNGLLSRYHLHFDKDLGIGKASVRRIPCVCFSCRDKKSISWKVNIESSK